MVTNDSHLGSPRVLWNVSFSGRSVRELVEGAAAAGFDAVSLLARTHRRALTREGLTNADLRAMLDDNGLAVTDVEATGDWLDPGDESQREPWLRSVYSTEEFLDMAEAMGAATLVAVHGGPPHPLEAAAEAFARLCDGAAERGVKVALEFPAMFTVRDVRTAWDIVRVADRPNGGLLLDSWHHRRSGESDDALAGIPPERIYSIQLADGAAQPVGDVVEDAQRRLMPGEGDLDVPHFLRTLDAMGVRAPIGTEVYDADLLAQGPVAAATRHMAALTSVLARAFG